MQYKLNTWHITKRCKTTQLTLFTFILDVTWLLVPRWHLHLSPESQLFGYLCFHCWLETHLDTIGLVSGYRTHSSYKMSSIVSSVASYLPFRKVSSAAAATTCRIRLQHTSPKPRSTKTSSLELSCQSWEPVLVLEINLAIYPRVLWIGGLVLILNGVNRLGACPQIIM